MPGKKNKVELDVKLHKVQYYIPEYAFQAMEQQALRLGMNNGAFTRYIMMMYLSDKNLIGGGQDA